MSKLLAPRPSRVFDEQNRFWNEEDRKQNARFVHYVQSHLNDLLRARGYVSLNEALELLGFERTVRGGQQGWIRDPLPETDDFLEQQIDGYIEFGVWAEGFARGKAWLNGDLDVMRLYFNVDRVAISMPRRIKKLRAEGKII